jgi:hypothetical protein
MADDKGFRTDRLPAGFFSMAGRQGGDSGLRPDTATVSSSDGLDLLRQHLDFGGF